MDELFPLRDLIRRTLAGEPCTWPRLAEPAVSVLVGQGIAPLLYANARVPELRDAAVRAAALEPLRTIDLQEVLAALAGRGVTSLLLKGAALAHDLYERPELRPRVDTDLLIDTAALPAAREVLLELGFSEQVTSGDEHALRQRMFHREDRQGVAHTYDLHWSVANSPLVSGVLRFDGIAPVSLPNLGRNALALPHVEALLLACVHRVAHHHDDERLIWLVDIAKLRSTLSAAERKRFEVLVAERRVLAICRRSFQAADEWLGADGWRLPDSTDDEPSRIFLDRELTYGAMTLANFRALPWPARLARLRQLAFPPVAFMRSSFPGQEHTAVSLLYMKRGIRGVRRLFGKAGER
jgi:hypothetical protein